MGSKLGQWSFIIGVGVAVVISLFVLNKQIADWVPLLLVVLGLMVGFLNVTEKETTPFLIACAALLITQTSSDRLSVIPSIGGYLANIVQNVGVFVTPAAILVALKAIWALAKD